MFKRELLTDPRTLAVIGVMTAIIFVLTRAVQIPTPVGGYVHLGDAGVLFTGFAFGPVVGTIAGALGTALADITSPYAQWAPFTLVIHGLMGFLAGYLVRGDGQLWRLLVASTVSGIVLVVGYFFAGWILVGWESALEVLPNILQIVAGALVSVPLYYAVRRAYPPLIWHHDANRAE
ncbi:MAG: ECF transporter S component [Anaerolineae bacterium]|nr:ECF transporter S component [Anaerolineae bacterium]